MGTPSTAEKWVLKSQLLDFKQTIGCHTGILIGTELIHVIRKFGMEKKVIVNTQ